ncbi:MAG: glycosyltransferase [Alphaproteobacteria bacterium]|nr:glycosyltransferase [Alphaproteobacteria bacterium]
MSKISIIIPVYNVEQYLPECLDSVLNQTYTDFEAICVNGGSTDDCANILKSYEKKDKRIKVITCENLGVSFARNKALDAATGDYIAFLDSDDAYAPDFLDKLFKALKSNDADVAWSNFYASEENPFKQKSDKKTSPIISYYNNIFNQYILETANLGQAIWNKLYKKDIIGNLRFNTNIAIAEDLLFLHQVLYNAKVGVLVNEDLHFYRKRPQSAMNSGFSKKIIDGNIQMAASVYEYFKEKEMPENIKKVLQQKTSKRIFKFAVLEPARKDKKNKDTWYNYTRPIIKELIDNGNFNPKTLSLKHRIKLKFWLKK